MKKIILLIILVESSLTYARTPTDGSIYSGLQCRVDVTLCPQAGQTYCEYVSCSGPVWSPYCKITDTYCRGTVSPTRLVKQN